LEAVESRLAGMAGRGDAKCSFISIRLNPLMLNELSETSHEISRIRCPAPSLSFDISKGHPVLAVDCDRIV
jgi:hypothetical protein